MSQYMKAKTTGTWTSYSAMVFRITAEEQIKLPKVGDDDDVLSLEACRNACVAAGATHWQIWENLVRRDDEHSPTRHLKCVLKESNMPTAENNPATSSKIAKGNSFGMRP